MKTKKPLPAISVKTGNRPPPRALSRRQFMLGSMAIGLLLGVKPAFADNEETTLLVWAGDAAHAAPDFIAVIDFDPNSPSYGKVLRTVPLSGADAIGNELHHVGMVTLTGLCSLLGLSSGLRGRKNPPSIRR